MKKKRLGSGRKHRERRPKEHGGGPHVSARRLLFGVLVTLLLIFLFSRLGALHKLQTFVTDVRMRLNDPPEPSEVAVVKISDADYREIFGGRSPLDPQRLRQIIDVIAAGGARVIGVDIDTSAPEFKSLRPDPAWPPVVWEREPKGIPESVEEEVEMLDVLGGGDEALNASSGLPLIIADPEDKVVRRYRRLIRTTEGPFPTLAWALASRFPHPTPEGAEPTEDDLFIRYAGDREGSHRTSLSAAEVLALRKGDAAGGQGPFRDKIVLLGGAYLDQDEHMTPLGRMRGVDVTAQVVEAELRGGGDRVPNKMTIFFLELFEGGVVVLLFQLFHDRRRRLARALALNLGALLFVSMVCSLAAFGSPLRFTYFLPLLVCVLIYEFSLEYRIDLVKELSKLFSRDAPEAH